MKINNVIFKRAASGFLCAVMLLLSVLPLVEALTLAVGAEGEPPTPAPVYVGFSEDYLNVTADEDNLAIFQIELDSEYDGNVTVFYHTENRSAIAPTNYRSVNSSVLIRKGETSVSVAVQCKGIAKWSTTSEGTVNTLHFAVVIDRTDVEAVKPAPARQTAIGNLRASHNLQVASEGRLSYFYQYYNYQTATHPDVDDIDGDSTWTSWDNGVSLNNATTQNWVTDFLYTDLAKTYATMLVKCFTYDANYHSKDPRVIMGNQTFINYNNRGRYDPGVIAWWEIEHCYNSFGARLTGEANELFAEGKNPHDRDGDLWDKVEYWDFTEDLTGSANVEDYRKQIYWKNQDNEWFASAGTLYHSMFYRIFPSGGVVNVGASFYNKGGWQDDELHGLNIKMMLVDDTKPAVESSYLDDSSLASTGKLRLILKFSEPVYVNNSNGTVSVTLYGADSVSSITKQFSYAGGNYTDTLYFEWKADKKVYTAYSFKVESTSNEKYADLAYNTGASGKVTNNQLPDYTSDKIMIDPILYSIPEITFTPKTSGWAKYHEVDVSMGNLTSGTLYYLWNESPDPVTDLSAYGSNCVEFDQPLTTLTFSQVNGTYYLHTLVVSPYGLMATEPVPTIAQPAIKFRFDNTPPTVEPTDPAASLRKDTLKTKIFDFSFYDTAGSFSGPEKISNVTLTVESGSSKKTYTIYNAFTKSTDPLFRMKPSGTGFSASYICSLVGLDEEENPATGATPVKYAADPKIKTELGTAYRGKYNLVFTFTDDCGNVTTRRVENCVFDERESVEVSVQYGASLTPMSGLSGGKVYDIGDDTDLSIRFTTEQTSGHLRLVIGAPTGAALAGITYHGEPLTDATVDAVAGDEQSMTLEGLVPGYYEITPYFVQDTLGEEEFLVAETQAFYVTAGWDEPTANYSACENDQVLRNEVYQLDSQFWYLESPEKNNARSSHLYGAVWDPVGEKYTGGSATPCFSSMNEVRDYVKYMEYQDLYLEAISLKQADELNRASGSSSSYRYVKADGQETITAAKGQLWIRYKSSTWTPASNSYKWVYYYYGEGLLEDGIDIRNLSTVLCNAINAVRDTICRNASVLYLVGEDGTDPSNGAPTLKPEQMHTVYESATVTHAGTLLSIPAAFAGDHGLYDGKVTDGDDDVLRPLATNLSLSVGSETKLFYHSGYRTDLLPWQPLNVANGTTLIRALGKNAKEGVYTVLECDGNGGHIWEVYFDNEMPTLKVRVNGDTDPSEIDASETMHSAKSFVFDSLIGENDPYAYVAVYSATWRLLNVYYAKTIKDVELPADANYNIEVGDRSGNTFFFTLRMAPGELKVSVELSSSGNGVIVTVADRTESEIYRYEVYCNGKLVSSEFAPRKLYSEPGIYTVFVQDIYGNAPPIESVTYHRPAPELTWSYQNSYGTYSNYNPNSIVSMMITDDETVFGRHYVSTSTFLRFRMSEGNSNEVCRFRFEGDEGLEKGIDYQVDTLTGRTVTINKLSGWTLKVWYADPKDPEDAEPETYETYVCVVDDTPPTIHVSYVGTPYLYDEMEDISQNHSLIPKTLTYTPGAGTVLTASNGGIITSRFITVTADDNFGVKLPLTVTLNGKPILCDSEDGSIQLNEYGEYRITASDLFGNTGTFTFTNTASPIASFTVDGVPDLAGNLADKLLGNGNVVAAMTRDGEIEILITRGGVATYRRYKTMNGTVYAGQYQLVGEEGQEPDSILIYENDPAVTISLTGATIGEWYELERGDGYTVSVLFSKDRLPSFRVTCEEGEETIEIRATAGTALCPSYRKVELSRLGTDIPILSGDKTVSTNQSGEVVTVAAPISLPDITDPKVTRVEESYSETTDFRTFVIFYDGTDYYTPIDHSEKGFYCVRVTNIYGNTVTYVFRYADAAGIVVTATYADEATTVYSGTFNGVIRSDHLVTLDVYGMNIRFTVNGIDQDGIVSKEKSTLVFRTEGTYEVTVTDAAGVENTLHIAIGSDPGFTASESWLTGYNEKALRRSERYTNTRLNVVLPTDGSIAWVTIRHGAEETVVYDRLSQESLTDPARLNACVGLSGDGTYEVCFRNRWGEQRTLTVHYRETPTLLLSRVTAFSGVNEPYPVADAVLNGFRSSNSITFATVASRYEFTFNGEAVSLDQPVTYEFDSASGFGSFEHAVTYRDEYGFEYGFDESHRFWAILSRQNVPINTSGMVLTENDGTLYTARDVFVTFPEDCTATLTFGGEEPVGYLSGTHLRRDGTYHFTVVDQAGNVSVAVIVRDSVVGFSFTPSSTDIPIFSGNVINDEAILFHPAVDDSTYIVRVFRDGEEQKNWDSARFAETGRWEVLLADQVGNTAYFTFTLINHAVSHFDYEAPYGYTVTEVWWTDPDGNRQLTTLKGDRISLTKDGDYAVIMVSEWDLLAVNFTVTIDTCPPAVTLVGCADGEETFRNVTLSGLSLGDTVEVYRNGVLYSKTVVETASDVPFFDKAGNYEVVVRNRAGSEITFTFTHKYVANTATSVLIIVACVAIATGIFIGLLYRNRSKIDE